MRNILFDIVDGSPIINAPLVNLKQFKRLWELDKTEDKSEYLKWLLYIYYMCDYRSAFFEVSFKEEKVMEEVFGDTNISIPIQVKDCMAVYIERNTIAEQRALEGTITTTDSITDTLSGFRSSSNQLQEIIDLIDLQIQNAIDDTNHALASSLMKQKMDLQNQQLDIIKKAADMIPKVEKNVEALLSLRKKVEEALDKHEDFSGKLENFIVHDFIDKRLSGAYTRNLE